MSDLLLYCGLALLYAAAHVWEATLPKRLPRPLRLYGPRVAAVATAWSSVVMIAAGLGVRSAIDRIMLAVFASPVALLFTIVVHRVVGPISKQVTQRAIEDLRPSGGRMPVVGYLPRITWGGFALGSLVSCVLLLFRQEYAWAGAFGLFAAACAAALWARSYFGGHSASRGSDDDTPASGDETPGGELRT